MSAKATSPRLVSCRCISRPTLRTPGAVEINGKVYTLACHGSDPRDGYRLTSPAGDVYDLDTANPAGPPICDCPDSTYRQRACKHSLALCQLAAEIVPEPEPDAPTAEEADRLVGCEYVLVDARNALKDAARAVAALPARFVPDAPTMARKLRRFRRAVEALQAELDGPLNEALASRAEEESDRPFTAF